MYKKTLPVFIFFLIDLMVSKRMISSMNFLQTKTKSLQEPDFFMHTGHKLFQNQDIKFMIPQNFTNYTENDVLYFHPKDLSPMEGILKITKIPIPTNNENFSDFYIGAIQRFTNNSLDNFIPYPVDNFTIGGFDGFRYFFNMPYQNETIHDGYVATMEYTNKTLYIIYAYYPRRNQAEFRRAVETIIATIQKEGYSPPAARSQFANDLYGCWLKIDLNDDYFSNYRIFTNLNFTRENDYNILIEEYTSIFGDLKMTAEYGQNGKYLVEGNVITILDPKNHTNIITFNKYGDGMLIDGRYYGRC